MRIRALTAAICLCITGVSAATEVDTAIKKPTNIPAQALGTALQRLAKDWDFQVIYVSEEVNKLRTQGATGELTSVEALKQLLHGTGLTYRYIDKKTVTIVPQSANTAGGGSASETMQYSVRPIGGNENLSQLRVAEALALAEDAASSKSAAGKSRNDVEEMIVEEGRIKPFTTSNVDIPRTTNDSQPYYIFDSETIERSAALNIQDFLKQYLTMSTMAQTPNQQVGATGGISSLGSISVINLRGLGEDKTLVLVNGRRVAGPPNNGSGVNPLAQADLNSIPLSAIDRIEVLPASASGIYGGSALGGVINVILKSNYTGGEVRLSYDNTWSTDAPARTLGARYGIGFNGGKTYVMLSGSWSDAESLLLQDRRELYEEGLATVLRNSRSYVYSTSVTTPLVGALPNITSSSESILNPDGTYTTIADPGTLTLKNGTPLGSRFTYIPAGTTSATSRTTLNQGLINNAGSWNLDLPDTLQNPTGLQRRLSFAPTVKSLMVSLRHQVSSRLEANIDISHSENSSFLNFMPFGGDQIRVSSASPLNPFNSAVRITFPSRMVGTATTRSVNDGITFGLRANLPHSWVAQLDYGWSKNKQGPYYFSRFDPALLQGGQYDSYYPGAVNTGEVDVFVDTLATNLNLDKYLYVDDRLYGTTLNDVAIRGSGGLPALPWGTPNLTVGLEHRLSYMPTTSSWSLYPLRPVNNVFVSYFAREQQTDSLYAETLIPLLKQGWLPMARSLELQLSGRSERYMLDTGTDRVQQGSSGTFYSGATLNDRPYFSKDSYISTNGTMGLKYEPISGLILRASRATAFLPPTSQQLVKDPLPSPYTSRVNDPKNNNAQADVQTIAGGNPNLTPQNSKSVNAGVIWQPSSGALNGLRVNIEYYEIEQFDTIGNLSAQDIVNNENLFADRIVRNSLGAITFVDTSMLNLYRRKTSGMDISLDYRLKTAIGNFNLRAAESVIRELQEQYAIGLPQYEKVGFPGEGGAAKHKGNLNLLWDYRNWAAGWSARYFGSYKQVGAPGGYIASIYASLGLAPLDTYLLAQGAHTIPSQLYHDMYVGYAFDSARSNQTSAAMVGSWLSGLTIQAGVKNVFDKTPPFDAYFNYYLSPYGDLRMRSYWLTVKKSF